jgi:hypothetical protein
VATSSLFQQKLTPIIIPVLETHTFHICSTETWVPYNAAAYLSFTSTSCSVGNFSAPVHIEKYVTQHRQVIHWFLALMMLS